MTTANSRPEKESYLLVRFLYGDSLATEARYTDWDQSVSGYASEPRMAVDIPENTGTFDKKELKVVLPLDSFTGPASSGSPHSPIFVIVEEVTQGLFTGDQNTQLVLFKGRVQRVVRNYQGQSNAVAFLAVSKKGRLEAPLGITCTHHCIWNLFQGGCGVSTFGHTVACGIDSMDGQEATITTAAFVAKGTADARYWKRGFLRKDGLRISIRDYDGATDPSKVFLSRRPPDSWIGGVLDITAQAGCDKTVETCRDRFNGEEFFMGAGFAIPPYQPNIESPS